MSAEVKQVEAKFVLIYTGLNIFKINHGKGALRLLSGVNMVTRRVWDEVKSHRSVSQLFSSGILEWEGASPDDVKPEDDKRLSQSQSGLASMNEMKAIKLIQKTISVDSLKEWQVLDARKPVLDAISKQLNDLIPTDKDFEQKK